jgi:hypothetical protein
MDYNWNIHRRIIMKNYMKYFLLMGLVSVASAVQDLEELDNERFDMVGAYDRINDTPAAIAPDNSS